MTRPPTYSGLNLGARIPKAGPSRLPLRPAHGVRSFSSGSLIRQSPLRKTGAKRSISFFSRTTADPSSPLAPRSSPISASQAFGSTPSAASSAGATPGPGSGPGPSATSTSSSAFTTINSSEIDHFSRLSSQWWSESGEFKLLHRMNPARIEYMRQIVALDPRREEPWTFENRHLYQSSSPSAAAVKAGEGRWLEGMRCLDVGCGGGLLSESLARLGGDVIGIDASGDNIKMATLHASEDPFLPFKATSSSLTSPISAVGGSDNGPTSTSGIRRKGSLEYRHTSAEALRDQGAKFDVVCGMEVVEHVDQPAEFMKALGDMVKPGGYLILSTISRTPLSRLLTLTLAEDVLRLVTPGTHTYSKFINPEELRRFVYADMGGYDTWEMNEDASDVRKGEVGSTQGIVYDPIVGRWRLWDGVEGTRLKGLGEGCNYMFSAKKRVDAPS